MRFCREIDLSICGLLITTLLFFLPGVIFLVLASKCVGSNNNASEKTSPSGSCTMVDNETIIILFVFGTLFVFVGVVVCTFAFIVHRANAKQKRQDGNQFSMETLFCEHFLSSVAGKEYIWLSVIQYIIPRGTKCQSSKTTNLKTY